jgi:hypothetical protein
VNFSSRFKLLAIMALFALPIAASLAVYHLFPPDTSTSYGELLLPPDPITSAPFARVDGGKFRFDELGGHWLLLSSDSGTCSETCLAKLTLMRQVRQMLGRNAIRVIRVFVATDGRPVAAKILAAYEGTLVIAPLPGAALPPTLANAREHVYVVDPLGNVMMRFPADADPRRMLKDLERLLKASQIG